MLTFPLYNEDLLINKITKSGNVMAYHKDYGDVVISRTAFNTRLMNKQDEVRKYCVLELVQLDMNSEEYTKFIKAVNLV